MLLRHFIAEFIGTCWLVFIGCGSIVLTQEGVPLMNDFTIGLAFGLAVFIAIISLKNYSVVHINPAVTIALWIHKSVTSTNALTYIAAQLTGGILGAYLLDIAIPFSKLGVTQFSVSQETGFFLEFLMTAVLMLSIVIASQKLKINETLKPAIIGFTIFLFAWLLGPLTGASMNPARSIGPAVIANNFNDLWIYCVSTIVGSVFTIKLIYPVLK